jgi:hypothetical protein
MRNLLPIASAVLFVLSGCSSSGLAERDRSNWILVGVEYLPQYAANAGVMPTFRKPGGAAFAGPPSASGSLRMSETGNVAANVRFDEPVVGFSGRLSGQRYDVINFFGVRTEGGDRILARGSTGEYPLGVPTELRLTRVSDLRLRVHPYTRDFPSPYVFLFAADAAVERPVEIPFVD